MKPRHELGSGRCLARHEERGRRRGLVAGLVVEFQPPRRGGLDFDSGEPARRPNFTRLASEVLRADASRSFRLETAVLGFVSLVCAWPIAIMIHEVYRLLK